MFDNQLVMAGQSGTKKPLHFVTAFFYETPVFID
jgi:hypothetical protein